ncbi:uncharacterized protein PRCAT00006172001 [Priceomyces carsonii]|uniref:uncharacterized protein n=1 Tax=Priceomyces carsonii TaxID=28549 RepID=UPI002ED94AB1|nr:unnamed protein product [Priceomyces carsonii]
MEQQQEIGGAQALLQLGSKNKDEEDVEQREEDREDESDDADQLEDKSEVIEDQAVEEDDEVSESDLAEGKATNQQINDAVEAAVMRYVGGTLDDNNIGKKGKRKHSQSQANQLHEDLMSNINEFNQWTGFLEDEIGGNGPTGLTEHTSQQSQSHDDYTQFSPRTPKKRKKRKTGHNDIDPELTGLDSTTEHDQLVQATILDARELAKQLGNGVLHDHDINSLHNSLNGLPSHQAQQVIAAATAAVQNQGQGTSESAAAINQLAQAASSLSGNGVDSINRNRQLASSDSRRSSKKSDDSIINYSMANVQPAPIQRKPKFNHLTSVEALVEEASAQACNWYNSLPQSTGNGPRIFSSEEIAAVDHFITGYCHLHKLTRKDICNRIWSNERKKDNFWELLTRVLPYRSRASVYKHVRRQYHVFDVRAKWTKEDDELLRKLASTKEGNWKEIGEIMGRMPEDCRDRWRNYVKCGENRVLNKWSEDEEKKLKDIVTDMVSQPSAKDKQQAINWTIVSERMNGVRSRIQCRYKWNKLLRRESAVRSSFMNEETRVWLLQKLLRLGFQTLETIDWDYIAHLYIEERKNANKKDETDDNWSSSDFKVVFEKMKSDLKDHKKLSLQSILQRLLDEYYGRSNLVEPRAASNDLLEQHNDHSRGSPLIPLRISTNEVSSHLNSGNVDPTDPTSIANAAVAAVSSGVDGENLQQDYSLWR